MRDLTSVAALANLTVCSGRKELVSVHNFAPRMHS